MDTKKKILLGVLAVIIIIVGGMFFMTMFNGSKDKTSSTGPSAAPSIADTTPTATVQPTVDNAAVAGQLQVPPEMQAVIDENQADLYVDEGTLAKSYPSNLLPLYKVAGVGDSNDITTNNGNPGWTAVYGSTADTAELAQFYTSLMASAQNLNAANEEVATNITGTVEGCNISINITPNNPQRTGLDYASSVSIFIEKIA